MAVAKQARLFGFFFFSFFLTLAALRSRWPPIRSQFTIYQQLAAMLRCRDTRHTLSGYLPTGSISASQRERRTSTLSTVQNFARKNLHLDNRHRLRG